jgi:hypothetical protein
VFVKGRHQGISPSGGQRKRPIPQSASFSNIFEKLQFFCNFFFLLAGKMKGPSPFSKDQWIVRDAFGNTFDR